MKMKRGSDGIVRCLPVFGFLKIALTLSKRFPKKSKACGKWYATEIDQTFSIWVKTESGSI